MNSLMKSATAEALLALGAFGLNSLVHVAELPTAASGDTAQTEKAIDEKYERDALKFEANADLHSRMAERYRTSSNDGSKQRMTLWSLASHYDWLAKTDREAAEKARNIASSRIR